MIPYTLLGPSSHCIRYGCTWTKLSDEEARWSYNARCSVCGAYALVNWKPDPVLEQEC